MISITLKKMLENGIMQFIMKFLNYDRVLCLSPHPDDVEYGMLGTILKYKDTQFDIIVISQGGDFDNTSNINRY